MAGKKGRNKNWQVGPNVKPEVGSQGTLFRGNQGISDARYPKGYTPERQHDIANAVGGSYTKGQGMAADSFRDFKYNNGGRAEHEPMRRLVDNVARSTVPLEHLQPVAPARSLSFWVGKGLDANHERDNTAGTYNPDPPGHMGTRNDIRIHTAHVAGTTPIHEIGHHVSYTQGNVHSSGWKGRIPVHRGTEEGFADAYAYEHFRDRRGNQLKDMREYPADTYYKDSPRQDEFGRGYDNARSHIPTPKPLWHTDPPKSIQNDSPTFNSLQRTGQTGLFSLAVSGGPRDEKFEGFKDADWHEEDKKK